MFETGMLLGLGAVAVWTRFRFPRLGPASLVRSFVHVAISLCVFVLVPAAVGVLLPLAATRAQAAFIVLGVLVPTLTYLLLSWVWLIEWIVRYLNRGPRGGHPASARHS
jgi:putative effector of murein hydrolase LrgA (UPF0299 family)